VVDVPRAAATLVDRFATAAVPDIVDMVGAIYCISPAIRPLYSPMKRICGSALTVKAWPGDNLAIHGALGMASEGDVLVVDWRGYVAGCGAGARTLAEPQTRGLRGVVIDGAWRDVVELQDMEFPVYARSLSPFSPPKARPGEINVPVACGGVVVEPGDIIVADEEGIVVVPLRWAPLVADALAKPESTRTPEQQRQRAASRAEFFRWHFEANGGVTDRSRDAGSHESGVHARRRNEDMSTEHLKP
jgi:regulator of RNase E activity RraA